MIADLVLALALMLGVEHDQAHKLACAAQGQQALFTSSCVQTLAACGTVVGDEVVSTPCPNATQCHRYFIGCYP